MHNYLYAEGLPPARLAEIGRAEAAGYGVRLLEGSATAAAVLDRVTPRGSRFTVEVDSGDGGTTTVAAHRLLLATGLVDVLPDTPGVRERWGRDVLHCPFCHGWEVRDQPIGVIGTGPMAQVINAAAAGAAAGAAIHLDLVTDDTAAAVATHRAAHAIGIQQ